MVQIGVVERPTDVRFGSKADIEGVSDELGDTRQNNSDFREFARRSVAHVLQGEATGEPRRKDHNIRGVHWTAIRTWGF
jgi:hypothetical protein